MLFQTPQGPRDLSVAQVFVAGWTGRDSGQVQHHIRELEAIGVAPPSETPLFYRVSAALLCQSDSIQVLGPDTSGEAEPLIVRSGGRTWLGLASDHTDRKLETHSVAHSKQACMKPAAGTVWPMDEVAGHLDRIEIRSWLLENEAWVAYQDGTLAQILPLEDLIAGAALPDGAAMLCGTVPAVGGVRAGEGFSMELHDPVRDRTIRAAYRTVSLDIVT